MAINTIMEYRWEKGAGARGGRAGGVQAMLGDGAVEDGPWWWPAYGG